MTNLSNRPASRVMGMNIASDGEAGQRRAAQRKKDDNLGEQVDRLSLIVNAMWELLQQAWPDLTVEHLTHKMQEIDARDDVLDGSNTRPASNCPSPECGAKIMPGQSRCQYCGTDSTVPFDPFVV